MKMDAKIIEIMNKKENTKSLVVVSIDEYERMDFKLIDGQFPLFKDVVKTLMYDKDFNALYRDIIYWQNERKINNKYKLNIYLKPGCVVYSITEIHPNIDLYDKYELFSIHEGRLVSDIKEIDVEIFLQAVKDEFSIDLDLPRKKYKKGLMMKHFKSLDDLDFKELKL